MTEKTIRPGSIQAWFAAIRPKTWGVALAPIFIGISMALSETGHGRLLLGLLTIAVAVAIQALTNMENDVGYTKRKAEKGNRKGLPGRQARGGSPSSRLTGQFSSPLSWWWRSASRW